MNLAEHIKSMPKKSAKKKAIKKAVETKPKVIEKLVPVAPVIKHIKAPDYSESMQNQMTMNALLAEQAIASMRDSVNNNQAVMAEVINRISIRPKEFLIVRDNKGDMTKIIPVYE